MSQLFPQNQDNRNRYKAELEALNRQFPNISQYPLDLSFLDTPALQKLVNLVRFSIPVHTYQPELESLYQKISETYYAYVFRDSLKPMQNKQNDVSLSPERNQTTDQKPEPIQKKMVRTKMNYSVLARFIDSYNPQMQIHVSQQVIRQGQRFQGWQAKEISIAPMKQIVKKQKKDKNERQQTKITRQKEQKSELVSIQIGKNYSQQTMQMKRQLIKRAQSYKLISQNQIYTELQKVGTQVNYILNRITESYFDHFLEQLRFYAVHQIYSYILAERIIEKIQEEHNYISLYCRLLKSFRKLSIQTEEEPIKFKAIFIKKLQQEFYKLIRKRQWTDKQELYKKQLLGMSIFLGELIQNKVISKFIFPDIFLELMSSYIQQYKKYQNDKSFFYHQIYVECIIKTIEAMGTKYQQLIAHKTNTSISSICDTLQSIDGSQEINFSEICDFIGVLKEINKRLPSQRSKISFLLQDFRCSKAITRHVQKEQNHENEVVKTILTLDHQDFHDIMKIGQMVSKCDPKSIMKDYYYQFAEGNCKQVNKNIQTFKLFMHLPGIHDAALFSLKENLEGLSMNDCDFPLLAEGIAKIMKQVCDHYRCLWQELKLSSQDEDIMEFIEKIQSKFFKMIVQD